MTFTPTTYKTRDIEYPKKVVHCCPSLTEETRVSLILHAPLQRTTMLVDSPLKRLLQASLSLARDTPHRSDTNTFYHHSIQRDDLVPLLMTLARSHSSLPPLWGSQQIIYWQDRQKELLTPTKLRPIHTA